MSREQRIQHQDRLRFSHLKDLDSGEVRALLAELCVRLGFCLPPLEIERFASFPPEDSNEFTEAVLIAEGYGVPSQDRVVDQARQIVADAFMRHRAG